jgi:hypothetical protein
VVRPAPARPHPPLHPEDPAPVGGAGEPRRLHALPAALASPGRRRARRTRAAAGDAPPPGGLSRAGGRVGGQPAAGASAGLPAGNPGPAARGRRVSLAAPPGRVRRTAPGTDPLDAHRLPGAAGPGPVAEPPARGPARGGAVGERHGGPRHPAAPAMALPVSAHCSCPWRCAGRLRADPGAARLHHPRGAGPSSGPRLRRPPPRATP